MGIKVLVRKEFNVESKKYACTCRRCESVMEYEHKDLISTVRNELYLECPVCLSYNEHLGK